MAVGSLCIVLSCACKAGLLATSVHALLSAVSLIHLMFAQTLQDLTSQLVTDCIVCLLQISTCCWVSSFGSLLCAVQSATLMHCRASACLLRSTFVDAIAFAKLPTSCPFPAFSSHTACAFQGGAVLHHTHRTAAEQRVLRIFAMCISSEACSISATSLTCRCRCPLLPLTAVLSMYGCRWNSGQEAGGRQSFAFHLLRDPITVSLIDFPVEPSIQVLLLGI